MNSTMAAKKANPWGAELRDVREKKRLTQERAAEILGVPLDTYQNWEQGRSAPASYFRKLVEDALKRHKGK